LLLHVVKLLLELLLRDLADCRQDAQAIEEATVEVGLAKGAQAIALWKNGRDIGRDEVVGEESVDSH
jgi:hypothetical protein